MSLSRDDGFTCLADYRAPAWRVLHAGLAFELDPAATEVEATLSLEPDPAQPGQPLVLEGEDLVLLAIELDGRALARACTRAASCC